MTRLLGQGMLLAAGTIAAFAFSYWGRDMPFEVARTTMFSTLVVAQMFHVYNVRAEGSSLSSVAVGSNPLLAFAVLGSLILQVLVVYLPIGQDLFHTEPIDAIDLVAVIVCAAASFGAIRATGRT